MGKRRGIGCESEWGSDSEDAGRVVGRVDRPPQNERGWVGTKKGATGGVRMAYHLSRVTNWGWKSTASEVSRKSPGFGLLCEFQQNANKVLSIRSEAREILICPVQAII